MKYRKEIDGLRALAVLPVILFHAGFTTFSGGFVGVDIFFVISGYLITTIIVDEMEKGSFSLLNFYERRARRILPALLFVMLCTLPFAWFWMLPQDLKMFSESIVAVLLFVSNVLFYLTSGYFDTASELKPLLHTWSLAVEEQYYVLFPIFLMLTWKLGKKWIISLLLLVAIVSVFAAQWGSKNHPDFTFFLLPTRGFELLIGALISLYINYKFGVISVNQSVSQSFSQSFSLAGLALVLYAIFAFDSNTPSPSLYTLIPTIGAGLILVFANTKNLVGKLLGSKLFVGIGLISYSTYLWHQPLFSFARLRTYGIPSTIILIILCFASVALGYISWKYIENPYRNKKLISSKKLLILLVTPVLFLMAVGLITYSEEGFPKRVTGIPEKSSESIIGTKIREKCDVNFDGKTGMNIDFCSLGDTNKTNVTLAIFGDSHSEAILPVLDKIGKERHEKYSHIALGGCVPFLNVDVARGSWKSKTCENLATKEYNFVKDNKIKNIFLVGRWSLYTDGNYDKSRIYYLVTNDNSKLDQSTTRLNFEKSLKNTIKKYQDIGVNVFLLAQIPQQKIDGDSLYKKLYWFNEEHKSEIIKLASISKSEHLALQAYNRSVLSKLQNELKFTYIDVDNQFCDNEKCYFGDETTSKYRDADHLSVSGSLSLYNVLNSSIDTH